MVESVPDVSRGGPRTADVRALACALVPASLSGAVLLVVLRLAVSSVLSSWAVGLLAPAALLALVAFVFRAAVAMGVVDPARPLHRRHGFWVVAMGTVIGLPTLGTSGLIDPWETHYAEVAREMLERGDFISPWWGHEGWFMSKPVLLFWLEALAMVAFGVRTGPDQVLAGVAGEIARPEWAVRAPGFALALVGSYMLYDGVARTCGRRAGFLGALALWTMPGFALLSHQAITDMPLVAGIAASLGLFLRALTTSDSAIVRSYTVRMRGREVHVGASHMVAIAIALVTVPQIVILLLQHVQLDASGLHLHPDRLVAGSPHACTLPGQPACTRTGPAHARLTPGLQAMLWTIPVCWLILRAAGEKRTSRLFALAAWGFAALAAMAKGPVGLVVPLSAVLAFVLARRSFREVFGLEILTGLLLATTMIGPWYLAAYARHGRVFIDELVMRHMLARTIRHLHDTNVGEDVGFVYFVRQLGYATFPWSGIALVSVLSGAARQVPSRRSAVRVLLFGATIVSFALVSSMQTKFHHYSLIAVPPIAMLTGVQVDEILATATSARGKGREEWVSGMLFAAACLTALVGRDIASTSDGSRGPANLILLLTYRYSRACPSRRAFVATFAVLLLIIVLATLASVVRRLREKAIAVICVGGLVFSAIVLDAYLPRCTADGGQRDVIAAYYRDRPAADHAPLVAYQLNWKGENFYTGNHLAIFVSSGATMKTYLDRRRDRGERTVYFVTERGRVRTLRHEIGKVESFTELTGPDGPAEFTVVRVQL